VGPTPPPLMLQYLPTSSISHLSCNASPRRRLRVRIGRSAKSDLFERGASEPHNRPGILHGCGDGAVQGPPDQLHLVSTAPRAALVDSRLQLHLPPCAAICACVWCSHARLAGLRGVALRDSALPRPTASPTVTHRL
jgi:hypothetical protein